MNAAGWVFIGFMVTYAAWYVGYSVRAIRTSRRRHAESMDASVRAVLGFLDMAPLQLQLTPEQATRAAVMRNDLEDVLGAYLIPVAPSGPLVVVSQ